MPLKSQLQIMVVDDMSVSRGLIEQSLDEIGLSKVQYESDGASAYRRLISAPVHLVISDMNMPGMDGLTLLEALRGQKAGMNNFIPKPFTSQQLLTSIEAVTGKLQ